MAVGVRAEDDGSGREVIRKEATGDDDVARLHHEAEILAAARHPGVVEVLTSGNDPAFLTTAKAGPTSLDACPALAIEEIAGLMAAVAETVADLHEMGIVHGRIEPSHIVLSREGRPVLCGFAHGGFAGAGGRLSAIDDVLALGELLRDLACHGATDLEPIPERRWWLGRLRPWRGYMNRALLTLADRACAEDGDRRPTARQFAAAVREAVPDARLPRLPSQADPYARLRAERGHEVRDGDRTRPLPWAVAVAGVVLLVLGLSVFGPTGDPSNPPQRAEGPDSAVSTSSRTSEAVAETPTIVAEGVVQLGGRRFAVGSPGDVLTVGDWDCDGASTVAVLRPSSGSVYAFDGWATETTALDARPVTRVEGAVALRAERSATGCEQLVAVRSDGSSVEVLV